MKRLYINQDHNEEKFWNGKGGEFWRRLSGYRYEVVLNDHAAESVIEYLKSCDGFAYTTHDMYGNPYTEEAVLVFDVEEE